MEGMKDGAGSIPRRPTLRVGPVHLTPRKASTEASHSSGTGVVLPLPSPSASAINALRPLFHRLGRERVGARSILRRPTLRVGPDHHFRFWWTWYTIR